MKKAPNQTARVHWSMGQALLPDHFYTQEQSLREELNLRLRIQSLPAWGVATLQWDTFQLLRGIVSIQEMTLVLPSGGLIDVPGNTVPAFVNLNNGGATSAPVFVHLQSGFEIVAVGRGELADEGIERVVQKIELSTYPSSETAAQSFKLAELACSADGAWSVLPSYLPPMLQVGASPFFDPYLDRMDGITRTLRQVLSNEIQDNYLAQETQTAAREFLRELFGFQALVKDVRNGIHLHPYELFRELRALYVDVCIYRGDDQLKSLEAPYDHEDLAGCFSRLLDDIEGRVQVQRREVPYVEFARVGGLLACKIEPDVRRARDVFFLVQKPQVGVLVDLARTKLASESRIQTVYERALRGIPFRKLDNPPFLHGLSAAVEFYTLTPGQEWDYAVQEGKVVLFDSKELAGCRMFLYWRSGEQLAFDRCRGRPAAGRGS